MPGKKARRGEQLWVLAGGEEGPASRQRVNRTNAWHARAAHQRALRMHNI